MIVFEKAPAKINLSLDVLNKREDGYHNVEMVMTTIDLSDRLTLRSLGIDEIVVMADNQYVPNDERNLAYKAARLFKQRFNITSGVHINIEKHIPVSAGLGGGSSDAAAVLRGLRRLWHFVGLSDSILAEIGSEIGSDVPFCVHGKTALATGLGEKLVPLPSPPSCWVVLARPDIGVSTRTIFPKIDLSRPFRNNTAHVIEALEAHDFTSLSNRIGNHLETVTLRLYPEVRYLKEKMQQYNIQGVMMSGSGPTIFGLIIHYSKARRIYNGLRGFCHDVKLVRTLG